MLRLKDGLHNPDYLVSHQVIHRAQSAGPSRRYRSQRHNKIYRELVLEFHQNQPYARIDHVTLWWMGWRHRRRKTTVWALKVLSQEEGSIVQLFPAEKHTFARLCLLKLNRKEHHKTRIRSRLWERRQRGQDLWLLGSTGQVLNQASKHCGTRNLILPWNMMRSQFLPAKSPATLRSKLRSHKYRPTQTPN